MKLEEIKSLCDEVIRDGLMFQQEDVMLNTEEGASYSAIAALDEMRDGPESATP